MQRKKANNNVTKSKNQRENKKQTKDKQTCSRQSWRSASATHVATVATSLERVLNTSKNTFRCWLLTIWMKRKVSFLVTWRTPIRQDMGRHESPSGQFQSTWCLLKNKTISVLRFSQILLQMQLYWSLKDHLKITFIVLFPHLIIKPYHFPSPKEWSDCPLSLFVQPPPHLSFLFLLDHISTWHQWPPSTSVHNSYNFLIMPNPRHYFSIIGSQ